MERVERDAIVAALRDSGGNRVAAAKLLGIARSLSLPQDRHVRHPRVIAQNAVIRESSYGLASGSGDCREVQLISCRRAGFRRTRSDRRCSGSAVCPGRWVKSQVVV
uniref:helix-turn-helix domain-containing protein n=1 Tax=Gordonia paraffinivorans TaxID=175628 RepID=UPI0020D1DB84|nr:helix-turn-helix domain-containing protein [Gordonia paraffinivorans]